MNKILLTLISAFIPVLSAGQFEYEHNSQAVTPVQHSFKDLTVSVSPNLLFRTPNGTQVAGGIKLTMFLGKRFSFDTEFILGNCYTLAGPGLIGIPAWLLGFGLTDEDGGTLSDILIAGLMIVLTAEHTSYHIPVNNSLELSPFISLLRLKHTLKFGYYDHPDVVEDQACFSAGLEINKYFTRFVISPYIEYNRGYTDHKPGINTGIYFGYYLPLGKK
jgi:hypothetical protein